MRRSFEFGRTLAFLTSALAFALSTATSFPAGAAADLGDRYTDLLLLAEHHQQVLSGSRMDVGVWDLDAHYRPVLMQAVPSRSLLGPIEPGTRCQLHFALGIEATAWPDNRGVLFRVSLRQEKSERLLFQEFVGAAAGPDRAWRPRAIDLPATSAAPFSIVFEAAAANDEAGAVTAGWSAPYVTCDPEARPPPSSLPNVVLISLDTLRADHLGVYGHAGATTPAIDAFAEDALVFDAAFTPAPWTLPAHASMFTGLYPDRHGAGHETIATPLPEEPRTLAEVLADNGYWTIAFSAGGNMSSANGLARGFQWWTQRTRANLEHTLPGVFSAVGVPSGAPRFLLLHTYDIHGPYGYLPGLPARRARTAPGTPPGDTTWSRIKEVRYHARYQRFERFNGVAEAARAYAAGVRFVDAQLGRLFERLKRLDLYDHSIIIVTSDHGESLYERKLYLGHSYTLFDEELRVPLVVRFPGGEHAGRTSELVSLVDLMPLVLGELGIAPPPGIDGQNPLAIDAARTRVRGEAAHTGSRYVRSRTRKWIGAPWPRKDPRSEVTPDIRDHFDYDGRMFDLGRDPGEEKDVTQRDAVPEGFAPLVELGERAPMPGAGNPSRPRLAPAREAELRALGYVE